MRAKITKSKDWYESSAIKEGDSEVGAGSHCISSSGSVVLPCPICGEAPSVETFGTCIDIECCVSMSRQKCDYLTIEEREMFSDDMINYADEVESKAYKAILSEWNTRTPQNVEGENKEERRSFSS